MLDFTTFLVSTGVGLAIVGRQELPVFARSAGTAFGRFVGVVLARLPKMSQLLNSTQGEGGSLQEMQHELRQGMRDLDAVRAEMGMVFARPMAPTRSSSLMRATTTTTALATTALPNTTQTSSSSLGNPPITPLSSTPPQSTTPTTTSHLATTEHALGAMVEDEWAKRGIDFTSQAERGHGLAGHDPTTAGSAVLTSILHQSLLYDQYDRALVERSTMPSSSQQQTKTLNNNTPEQQEQSPSR